MFLIVALLSVVDLVEMKSSIAFGGSRFFNFVCFTLSKIT
jgi:hypothetical protein